MKDADFRAGWHNTACRILSSFLCKGHADYVPRLRRLLDLGVLLLRVPAIPTGITVV
jgi:hypothetical protein